MSRPRLSCAGRPVRWRATFVATVAASLMSAMMFVSGWQVGRSAPDDAATASGAAPVRLSAAPVAAVKVGTADPKNLAALDRWMNTAIMAKGSVNINQAFVVTDGFVSRREIGTVRWTKGKISFDVTQSGQYVIQRYIVVPGAVYQSSVKPAEEWVGHRDVDLAPPERDYLTQLSRRMNPSLLYPGLSRLKVTRGKPLVIDGVRCWPYTVRMTLRQNLASRPANERWDENPLSSGTTVTTFYIDATGLPHKVVEASREGHTRINEVTVFTKWGTKSAITPPPLG